MSSEEKEHYATLLRAHLARAKTLRAGANAAREDAQDRLRLRAWQAQRLGRTHRDLLESDRYGAATAFFLSDLYGPKDFSARDEEVERILPMLLATLPAAGVHAVALAIELDALSEELDAGMVAELRRGSGKSRTIASIDKDVYARAYRRCGMRDQRALQIRLIAEAGQAQAALARKPLVHAALRVMRTPARLAGLGELHEFLDTGFGAFARMGDATEFLALITNRETALMERLFAGAARPFDLPPEA